MRTIAVYGTELQDMVLFVGTTTNCILESNLSGGRLNVLVQVRLILFPGKNLHYNQINQCSLWSHNVIVLINISAQMNQSFSRNAYF